MWQNFVHLKIEENHDIFLDEFRFFRVKDNSDVTNELGLDKDHASA